MLLKISEIKETEAKRDHGIIEFNELKESIKKLGLIEPIIINQDYKLLCGRRRIHAIRELGIDFIEVKIIETHNELDEFDIALDENIKRKQLTPLEEGQAFLERKKIYERMFPETQHGGDRKSEKIKIASCKVDSFITDTSKKLGVNESTISRMIQAAELVEQEPELAKEIKISRILRKHKINEQKENIRKLVKPTGLFDIIVIDPPWEFKQDYDPDYARGIGNYPTMKLNDIKQIKLPAKKDCIVWLWVTNNMIKEGFEVLEAWGLIYRNILTWDKEIMGIGSWLRNKTEHCLMATKGSPIINLTNETTIIHEKRSTHSKKPEAFYILVDKLCIGEKLDYFARNPRNGWISYGDEI